MQRQPKNPLYFETGPNNSPTMTVKPGEVFEIETQMNRGPDLTTISPDLRDEFESLRNPSTRGGNPSSGAILVEGAKAGDVLVVNIEDIQPHGIGYTQYRGSTGAMPGWLGPSNVGPASRVVRLKDGQIIWNDRFSIPMAPMLGVVGVAPFRETRHNGWAGDWGGNFDIQEVTSGAQVQIVIQVDGALLHVGDMHARQGDGEICGGGGIETGGIARLRVELKDRPHGMTWPRIEDPDYIMTTGQDKPAEDAFRIALSEMLLWLGEDYGMDQKEAYLFLAQVLEARITQFVNPSWSYVAKVNRKYLEWTQS